MSRSTYLLGVVKLVSRDAQLQRGSTVIGEMQTGGICTHVATIGSLLSPLLIYMPFLYIARSFDS